MATNSENTPARRIEDHHPDAKIDWSKPEAPAVPLSGTAGAARKGGETSEESSVNSPANLASQSQAAQPTKHTDLSQRLRWMAPQQSSDGMTRVLIQAADEIDRYYTGMMNWKATAEAKDAAHLAGQSQATNAQSVPSVTERQVIFASGDAILAGMKPGYVEYDFALVRNLGITISDQENGAPTAQEVTKSVPDILFDGYAVLAEVQAHGPNPPRTSADNVSEVLDAVVRLIRRAGTAQEVTRQAAPEEVRNQAQAVVDYELDEVRERAHPCDQNNDDVVARHMSPVMQKLRNVLKRTSTEGAQAAPEEALIEARIDVALANARVEVAMLGQHNSAPAYVAALTDACKVIESLRTSTDQADTDTGSAA
jgi:hypothetical protein